MEEKLGSVITDAMEGIEDFSDDEVKEYKSPLQRSLEDKEDPDNSVRRPNSFTKVFNDAVSGRSKPAPKPQSFSYDEIRMGFDKGGDINMTPLDKRLTPFQEEMQRLQEEAKAVRSQRDAIDLAVETVWQSHPMNSLRTAPLEAKAAKLAIDFAKANPGISLIKAIRHGIDEALNVGPG